MVERRRRDSNWGAQQLGQEEAKDAEIHARMEAQASLWRDAVERGVKLAMGTDQSHRLLVGENLVELEYMARFLGMSAMETIVAATSKAAECIERTDIGTLEPGKRADVLAVAGDPLADIRVLQKRANIRLVMKDGRAFNAQGSGPAPP